MRTTILIADDDADDLEFFCDAVADIDDTIICLTAMNGEEALRMLSSRSIPVPDFIFLDMNMPRLNGRKCLVEIKKMDGFKDIPIIIYTTSKLNEDIKEMRNLGAVNFLTKPSRLSELRKAITNILQHNWEKVDAPNYRD